MENKLVESFTSGKRVGDGGSGFSKPFLYSHFDQSAVPLRFLYFRNERWCNFSDEIVGKLRTSFLQRKPITEAAIDGTKYIFDLKRLLQIEWSTGNFRSIAWIDQTFNCFFPNGFFDCIDSDGSPSKRKREEAVSEVGSFFKLSAVGNVAAVPHKVPVVGNGGAALPHKVPAVGNGGAALPHKVPAVGNGAPLPHQFPLEPFLLRIKNSLSPDKVWELCTVYNGYKTQTISKDAFVTKLREIAGEELLRSAIFGDEGFLICSA